MILASRVARFFPTLLISIILLGFLKLASSQHGYEYVRESYELLKQRRKLESGYRSLEMAIDEIHSRWGANVLADVTFPIEHRVRLESKIWSLHEYLLTVGNGLGFSADIAPKTKVILFRPIPDLKQVADKVALSLFSIQIPISVQELVSSLWLKLQSKRKLDFEELDAETQGKLLSWHWWQLAQQIQYHQTCLNDLKNCQSGQVGIEGNFLFFRWRGVKSDGQMNWLIGGERYLVAQPTVKRNLQLNSVQSDVIGERGSTLPYGALHKDARLRTFIELQTNSISLKDAVETVRKKVNVPLSVDLSVKPERKMAIRFKAPAWVILQSIADLYGLVWVKKGKGYELKVEERSPIAKFAFELSFLPCWWGKERWLTEAGLGETFAVAKEVAEFLRSREGVPKGAVPFNDLPKELQTRLTETASFRTAKTIVGLMRFALPDKVTLSHLRTRYVSPRNRKGFWKIEWVGRDGSIISEFTVLKPQQFSP